MRDALLGKQVKDIDIATPLLPAAVTKLLESGGLKVVPTGLDHGTVSVFDGEWRFEITTLRKDTACDGRHAEVAFTADWEEDARRRDFTMNALYATQEGEVVDVTNGIADLRQGIVRFIGNAEDRIQEDYLRILRFFRFFAYYGKGAPEAAGLAACRKHKTGIEKLSGERIQQEMMKLLGAPDPRAALKAMQACGVFPLLFLNEEHLASLPEKYLPPLTRLALLMHGKPSEKLLAHWKMSRKDAHYLTQITESPLIVPHTEEKNQKQLLRTYQAEIFQDLVVISEALNREQGRYPEMLELARSWPLPIFPVKGSDIMELGFQPGPEVGTWLRELETYWESEDYKPTKQELLRRIKR